MEKENEAAKETGNRCIITEKPRKETKGITRRKAVLHCLLDIHKIQL